MFRPEDYGFEKVRSGHRWEDWERGDSSCGYELVDDVEGEWVAYLYAPASDHYETAWSKGEARRKLGEILKREVGGVPDARGEGSVDPEFDFGGGL